MSDRDALLALRLARARRETRSGGVAPASPASPADAGLAPITAKTLPITPIAPIKRRVPGAPVPATPAQQALWFLEQLNGPAHAYYLAEATHFRGMLDVEALRTALQACVDANEAMRTTFNGDGERLRQRIDPAVTVPLAIEDVSEGGAEAVTARIRDCAREPFDLERGPLFRARLFRLSATEHVLLTSVHHIVSDGWSQRLMWSQIVGTYRALVGAGKATVATDSSIPAPRPLQAADVACWQQTPAADAHGDSVRFWRDALTGLAPLELPADSPGVAHGHPPGLWLRFAVPPALAEHIGVAARDWGVTRFMLLLAAYQVLLARLTGVTDFGIGVPVAGRSRVDIERVVGYFANTVVIRTDLSGNPSVSELIDRTRRTVLDALAHQDLPFERVVAELNPQRHGRTSANPLFQQSFALLNLEETLETMPGLVVVREAIDPGMSKYDLTFTLAEADGGFSGVVEYNSSLFRQESIARWAGYYLRLLETIVATPAATLLDLPLLDESERAALLAIGTGPASRGRQERSFRRFDRHAVATPEAIAMRFDGGSLSYADINRRVDRIGDGIAAHIASPGCRIGVCVERGPDLVASVLAILRSGAVWVPLDPADPADRLMGIVADADLSAVVVDAAGAVPLTACAVARIVVGTGHDGRVDDDGPAVRTRSSPSPGSSAPPFTHDPGPEDPAYLLYTSGSTGRPKGVLVPHRALENLLDAMVSEPGCGPDDRVLAITTPTFDIATVELLLPLTVGARIVLATSREASDPAAIVDLMAREAVTIAQATPTMWQAILEAGWTGHGNLTVMSGGEPLPWPLARELGERCLTVWNLYGPTETTVYSTRARINTRHPAEPAITIGRPIESTTISVIDAVGGLCPTGVPGEICIAGDGVALGYWKLPELTDERFLPDPACAIPGRRMYRTGDGGRWLGDGRLEHRGRLDDQIKWHGHRIEPGEIETLLMREPAVAQAVVGLSNDAGRTRLVAWLAAAPVSGLASVRADDQAMRDRLRAAVPVWMVPQQFVWLERLPMRSNGKADRAALRRQPIGPGPTTGTHPAPDIGDEAPAGSGDRHGEPAAGLESELSALWAELLDRAQVGVDDDFFELGGHSLTAMRLVSRVRRQFGVGLELRAVFADAFTVGRMARVIETARTSATASSDGNGSG